MEAAAPPGVAAAAAAPGCPPPPHRPPLTCRRARRGSPGDVTSGTPGLAGRARLSQRALPPYLPTSLPPSSVTPSSSPSSIPARRATPAGRKAPRRRPRMRSAAAGAPPTAHVISSCRRGAVTSRGLRREVSNAGRERGDSGRHDPARPPGTGG